MPNCCWLRNINQSCQWLTAGAANSSPATTATPMRNSRRRCPKNSWNRSTTGWVLAENADGASRSAITRLSTAKATNVPPNKKNINSLERNTVENTPARPTESNHR